MSLNTIQTVAQAASAIDLASQEPNWLLIGIILGVMVILAIIFLIPSRSAQVLDDADKEKKSKSLEDKSKETLSLSEIKTSKRAMVSEDKSKEELRELRRERRAQTQTEKAIHEREEAQMASEGVDLGEKASVSEKVAEVAEVADEKLAVESVEAPESEKAEIEAAFASPADDLLASSEADSSDVFASLFGESQEFSLDDELGGGHAASEDDGTVIPTLGSALISLDVLTRAAEEEKAKSGEKEDDEFAGFAMFNDSSEKKTLN